MRPRPRRLHRNAGGQVTVSSSITGGYTRGRSPSNATGTAAVGPSHEMVHSSITGGYTRGRSPSNATGTAVVGHFREMIISKNTGEHTR